jgi:hypothetical protein
MRRLLWYIILLITGTGSAQAMTARFEITGTGTLDGFAGYFMDVAFEGVAQETEFIFEEGPYLRMYAFRPAGELSFDVLPVVAYMTKTRSMSIGETWGSYVGEPATSTVTDSVEVEVPAGSFRCYVIETRSASDALLLKAWGARGVGWVQNLHFRTGWGRLADRYVAPGQEDSFFPLAVGNWWAFADGDSPVEQVTWGKLKSTYREKR